MKRMAWALLLACGLAGAGDGRDVELETGDGVRIAATFWAGAAEKGPAVVCLPMYRSERSAFEPLVPHLLRRGLAVLAIDLRGHGESRQQKGEDWMPRVVARDATLFQAMHEDAIAAVRWLAGRGRGPIGILGASVGCSVALDAARRYPDEIAAVACLTPGSRYLGLDSLAHARALPASLPVLLVSHADEVAAGTGALAKIIRGASVRIVRTPYPAGLARKGGYFHGTHMFGRVALIEPYVAGYLAAALKGTPFEALLDGDPVRDQEAWAKATAVGEEARAYRRGDRLVFGGRLPAGTRRLRLKVRAAKKGAVDFKALERGEIDLAAIGKFWVFSTVVEAPDGRVRESWATGGDHADRLQIVFSMQEERYGYEGELRLPGFEVVEASFRPEKKLSTQPPRVVRGPIDPAVLKGTWTPVPAR